MPSKFNASKSEVDSQKAVAKRDEILSKTHAETSTWIDANIVDMDAVRDYLKRLTRIVKANQEGLKDARK
tara:strand:- start:180 stop:389 length:210 start_codon:yes stop_codon:yes gene_type:complete